MNNNDALIEIAYDLMKSKNKPQTIQTLAKEVFEAKGAKVNEKSEEYAQFVIDFMLCGDFIACGEDKNGNKLWDLKNRQHHDMQDKEGFYIDNYYEDEEVAKNELKDDYTYNENNQNEFDNIDKDEDDEEEEKEEKDDIEEELEYSDDEIEGEEKRVKEYDADDDVEEDNYDDDDED